MKVYELFHPRTKKQRGFLMLADDARIAPSVDLPNFLELRDPDGWFAVIRDVEARELQADNVMDFGRPQ